METTLRESYDYFFTFPLRVHTVTAYSKPIQSENVFTRGLCLLASAPGTQCFILFQNLALHLHTKIVESSVVRRTIGGLQELLQWLRGHSH